MNISKSQSCEKGRTRRCSPRNLAKVGSLDLDQTRFDGANLLRRRLKDAGIVADYSPHAFRATGITTIWGTEGLWRSLSGLPATLIAARRSFMIAADKRFCSRIWKGFATKL